MIYSYYDPNLYYQQRNDNTYLFGPHDALLYGNIFKKNYIPYKNYAPKLRNTMNKKEELIRDIEAYTQASQDLKLFLDVNPTDKEAFNIFQDYSEKVNKLVKEYENKYDPVFAGNSRFENGYFSWITSPSVFYTD